jgi:hypothetical protein
MANVASPASAREETLLKDPESVALRCGCDVHASDVSHDVADCLERQADELAYSHELRWESGG